MIPHVNDVKNGEDELTTDYETKIKEVKWYHRLLLNRHLKVVTVGLLVSVVSPLLIYHYLFFPSIDFPPPDGFSTGSCLLPRSSRLPCGLGNVTDTDCHTQCCYDYELHVCFHRHPSRFTYILEEEWAENMTLTPRINTVPYRYQESLSIQLSVDEITPTHVVLTFYDPEQMTVESRVIPEKNYSYTISRPEMHIVVNDAKGDEIFNTVRGPIIAAENIWEIAFKTTNESMYGLGEIPLVEGMVKILYNNDKITNSVPLIFSRSNGTYHGLLLDVVEPTELRIEGDNQVVVRSITKRGLKIHLFAGPEPKDIMDEVMNVIGFKHNLEYWMLGVHVCSEYSSLEDTFDALSEFVTDAAKENLPYDSHCGVAPVVFHDDCKKHLQTDLIKGMELLKNHNKRFVPHISPYIFYEEPKNKTEDNSTETVEPRANYNCSNIIPKFENLLLKTSDSKGIYKGRVDNKTVLYPDYEVTTKEFLKRLWDGPDVDGVVLENNWPLDESLKRHNETGLKLPYFDYHFEIAFNHTPQWNITTPTNNTYIYTHNQYGNHFAEAFRRTTRNNVPIYSSAQWMTRDIVNAQTIDASWTNLQNELTQAALGGISGNWLRASPICGDTDQYNSVTQIHLCIKWYQAAAYLPLVKIHSKRIARHPLSFSGTNKANILRGLNHRYSLLSHFYTILQKGPLLRPMFYQFPFSTDITDLKTQFSVGGDLLIVPNLQPSQTHVHVYMPPGHWYEFWSGLPIQAEEGEAVTMTTTDADFLVLIRAGAIVVIQKDVKETAEETRRLSPYSLTIALDCETDNSTASTVQENIKTCYAEGELFITKNMTIFFETNSKELTIRALGTDFQPLCEMQRASWANQIKDINVFGLDSQNNNYDHLKSITAWLSVCQLETQESIVFNL